MPGSNEIWAFVITNLQGERLGEIRDAYERKFTSNLSKPSTASFQVRQDNEIVPYLFDENEDYLLQIWKGTKLEMWGPIISANLAMTEGAVPSIAVTAADPSWRLNYRLYWGGGAGYAASPTAVDKVLTAQRLLSYQAITRGGAAGMNLSWNTADFCGSTGTYLIPTGKSALTAIQELSQGFDGFDWYVEPIPVAIPLSESPYMPTIGYFRASGVVGTTKEGVRFEYGAGSRNVRSINYMRDQSTRANVGFNISEEGFEITTLNPTPLYGYVGLSTKDVIGGPIGSNSYGRYGIYDGIAELGGVNNLALRESYTQEMVNVRKYPRRVLGMTADIDDGTGRVPKFGVDYWLGDLIEARAVLNESDVIFNGKVRVYAVEVALDNAGTGLVTPVLVEEA